MDFLITLILIPIALIFWALAFALGLHFYDSFKARGVK